MNDLAHLAFRWLVRLGISLFSTGLTLVLLFFCVDVLFPDLIRPMKLEQINYFAQRYRYLPDSDLVIRPRVLERTITYAFTGDLALLPHYRETGVVYRSSYTREGFRPNSSEGPYDLMLVGDSFIEFGEEDSNTLTSILHSDFGISAANCGRHWYGPEQYNKIAGEYLPTLRPRVAVYSIFVGNDLKDVAEFARWQSGKEYYNFRLDRHGFFRRLKFAAGDTKRWIKARARGRTLERDTIDQTADDLATIRVEGEDLKMRFAFWPRAIERSSAEWQRLEQLLADFKQLCKAQGCLPLVLVIPTKEQVYARAILPGQPPYARISALDEATLYSFQQNLESLCRREGIEKIDLTPVFRAAAAQRPLLFWQFDTHWTEAGRRLAAETIADWVGESFRRSDGLASGAGTSAANAKGDMQ